MSRSLAAAPLIGLLLLLSGCATAPVPAPTVTVTVTATAAPAAPPASVPSQTPSESTAFAKESTCALGEAGISVLAAGGAAAQAFAMLIAEHVDDERIRALAVKVRDGSDTEEVRADLTRRLAAYCAMP